MELTKQQFIDRFTHPEFTSILQAGKTDVDIEGWLFRFNNADNPIDTYDPRTVQGVESFVLKGLLTEQRAQEILGLSWNGWHVGEMVRILPPFDASFPDVYPIQGFEPEFSTILVADSGFEEQFVEKADGNNNG